MNDIKQTYEIVASPADVWRALTDPKMIEKWSGAAAVFPLEVGAVYSLWDGTIRGEIVDVVPLEKLVQTWKPQDWTRTDSIVTFTLTPHRGGTRVDLLHVNVEESDFDGTTEGWDIYYLGAMKRMLETKARKARSAKAKSGNAKPRPRNAKTAKSRNTKTAKKAGPGKKKAVKKASAPKKRMTSRARSRK